MCIIQTSDYLRIFEANLILVQSDIIELFRPSTKSPYSCVGSTSCYRYLNYKLFELYRFAYQYV